MTQSEMPAVEALKKLHWVVSDMWKHTMHDELCCDAEDFGDPIHIMAKWSCGELTRNTWVINPHKKTVFWLGEEGDPKRRTVDSDLDDDEEVMFSAWVIIQEIDSTVDADACDDAFKAEHCEPDLSKL